VNRLPVNKVWKRMHIVSYKYNPVRNVKNNLITIPLTSANLSGNIIKKEIAETWTSKF
jgi:hypothetical protein